MPYEKKAERRKSSNFVLFLLGYISIRRKMSAYRVNDAGFYGEFGGAYVPEILYKTVEDLRLA